MTRVKTGLVLRRACMLNRMWIGAAPVILPWVLVCACGPALRSYSAAPIEYVVGVANPADGAFELTMKIPAVRGTLVVHLPSTTPGDMGFKQHARYLDHFSAVGEGGKALPHERTGAQTWVVEVARTSDVSVHYRVHTNERDILRLGSNGLSLDGGYLEGSSVFLYADGHMDDPVEVRYQLPDGWSLVTLLPNIRAGVYSADGYRALVDAPVQFGVMSERSVALDDLTVRLVFDRPLPPYDTLALDENIRAIIREETDIFGARPFSDYTVFVHWRPDLDYGGGLEHGHAMVLNVGSQWMLNLPVNAAGTIAHELFHAWNAESFYPHELYQWDFAGPNYSANLWFVEGVTSYLATKTLIRSGVLSEAQFFDMMSRSITNYENDAGRGWTSLAESSIASWIGPSDALDYYGGGEVIGFLLDLTLRLDTQRGAGAGRSLEDVLRQLYTDSKTPGYEGYDGARLRGVIDEVAGHPMAPFFEQYVTGRGPIDYAAILGRAGVEVSAERSPDGSARYTIVPATEWTPFQEALWREFLGAGLAKSLRP